MEQGVKIEHRDLYYGGAWHPPLAGRYVERTSPGDGMNP